MDLHKLGGHVSNEILSRSLRLFRINRVQVLGKIARDIRTACRAHVVILANVLGYSPGKIITTRSNANAFIRRRKCKSKQMFINNNIWLHRAEEMRPSIHPLPQLILTEELTERLQRIMGLYWWLLALGAGKGDQPWHLHFDIFLLSYIWE